MAQAKRDQNRVTTLIGVSSLDLITPTNAAVNPTTSEVLVQSDQTKIKETAPTDATKNNSALTLTYIGSNLTQIQKTIGGVTFTKSLSWTGSQLDSISAWS